MTAFSPQLEQARRLADEGKYAQSRAILVRLLASKQKSPHAASLMSFVCHRLGENAPALYYAQQAAAALPDDVEAAANLVDALHAHKRDDDALVAAQALASRAPDIEGASVLLTAALARAGRPLDALAEAERFLNKRPDSYTQLENAATISLEAGQPDRARELLRRSLTIRPDSPATLSALMSVLNYCEVTDTDEMEQARRDYNAVIARIFGPARTAWDVSPDPDRPLRIGLLSPDYRNHAMSYFIRPYFEHHDRERVHLTCYSTSATEDAATAEFKRTAPAWRSVFHLGFADMAAAIRADRIDILIELAGHSIGNALPMMHLKPAPLLATWAGYPGSTAVRSVDFRITDRLVAPESTPWAGPERPLFLDPCFLAWRPHADAPEVASPPRRANGFVTFGAFSSAPKLTETTLDLWSRVLQAVPSSRFLYKSTALTGPRIIEFFRSRFNRAGIGGDRLILEPPAADSRGVLPAYARLDISLDTFPYHGTTTTCESLWMGVPMVALAGQTTASRVNCSLLNAAGLGDLVAQTPEEYVHIAAALANDAARLDALRSPDRPEGLRARMTASPIRDEAGFARRLEHALRERWREWCATRRAS